MQIPVIFLTEKLPTGLKTASRLQFSSMQLIASLKLIIVFILSICSLSHTYWSMINDYHVE